MELVIFFIVLIIVFVFVLSCSQKSGYTLLSSAYGGEEGNIGRPQYSTAFHTVGHRPPTQDFLPTVGEMPLGSNDRLLESDMNKGFERSEMCNECVDTCKKMIKSQHNRDATNEEKEQCWNVCGNVCLV